MILAQLIVTMQSKNYSRNIEAFFALLRAGLWEKGVQLSSHGQIDFSVIFKLAEEQCVGGLIAAGLEQIEDITPIKKDVLPFMKRVIVLERRNTAMNQFIAEITKEMIKSGISSVLLKGQGVAQCYSRPLWRYSGDIVFLFDEKNFDKAKVFFLSLTSSVESDQDKVSELDVIIGSWSVELHGSLHCRLTKKIDKQLDDIQRRCFNEGSVRAWNNDSVDVLLPAPNEDVIVIFTHFLKHFYKGGLGLRQICDWCRLLVCYQADIDIALLINRLHSMHLCSEWKAFAAYVVDYLDMPVESMPLYDSSNKWRRKAYRIHKFIMEVGNFGHNRDYSYYVKYPYIIRKAISFKWRVVDALRHFFIFPLNSICFFLNIVYHGFLSTMKGE